MSDKQGRKFENLSKMLFEKLSEDERLTGVEGPRVMLPSPDGERECDLVLRSQVSGMELLTIVECRDLKRKLDITHLDGFDSKIRAVGANKGVLVSRNGFSKAAQSKAKRLGISLFVAHDVESDPTLLAAEGLRIPVIVKTLTKLQFHPRATIHLEEGQKVGPENFQVLNGRDIRTLFMDAIMDGSIPMEVSSEMKVWLPFVVGTEVWAGRPPHVPAKVKSCEVQYMIDNIELRFGYLDQLSSSAGLVNVQSNEYTLCVDPSEFESNAIESWPVYTRIKDVPEVGAVNAVVHRFPDLTNIKFSNFSIQKID